MATDLLPTVAGFLVAGLGTVYAYTQLGPLLGTLKQEDTHTHTRADADAKDESEQKCAATASGTARKGKKKKKGKGEDMGRRGGDVDEVADGSKDRDKDRGDVQGGTCIVIPGDFEAVGGSANVDVGAGFRDASPAVTMSHPGNSGKTKRRKKKDQNKVPNRNEKMDKEEEDAEQERSVETGKQVGTGRTASHGPPRSGDSTDVDAAMSASTSELSRVAEEGNPSASPHIRARAHTPSQPRGIRPSLSFDTDGSWTHVDRRCLKMAKSSDGQTSRLTDAIDVTSSDLASTESNSPVAERSDNDDNDIRGTRVDFLQRTFAERPEKRGIEDMLEQPDFPTLARVMRVQPRTDETPVPGFSWEDYGDVVEGSLIVHDADQEDDGEWGIVKSRNRTRSLQTTTSPATAVPESMTKKQRQNARKRELAKAGKAETEVARLEGLAKHKRELERLRIIEQSRQGGGKRPSGGMHAAVDDRGKLVWQ